MRLSLIMFIFSVILLVSGVQAFAEEETPTPGLDNCLENASEYQEISTCYFNASEYWDKILNDNYAKAKNQCKQAADERLCSQSLLSAQRTWLAYRDSFSKSLYDIMGTNRVTDIQSSKFIYMATKSQALILADIEVISDF
ncbi:MAG: DUF1311 domain-containing protein [Deltaproteobacteria bacterium]|nr:DUF1311 domain-containing protein [Deltaproteobacteria bacterium]